jgi:hypothetical protein
MRASGHFRQINNNSTRNPDIETYISLRALKSEFLQELVEDAPSQGQHIATPGTPIGKKGKKGGGEMEEGRGGGRKGKHKR